jgi:hypothetical protein
MSVNQLPSIPTATYRLQFHAGQLSAGAQPFISKALWRTLATPFELRSRATRLVARTPDLPASRPSARRRAVQPQRAAAPDRTPPDRSNHRPLHHRPHRLRRLQHTTDRTRLDRTVRRSARPPRTRPPRRPAEQPGHRPAAAYGPATHQTTISPSPSTSGARTGRATAEDEGPPARPACRV